MHVAAGWMRMVCLLSHHTRWVLDVAVLRKSFSFNNSKNIVVLNRSLTSIVCSAVPDMIMLASCRLVAAAVPYNLTTRSMSQRCCSLITMALHWSKEDVCCMLQGAVAAADQHSIALKSYDHQPTGIAFVNIGCWDRHTPLDQDQCALILLT
jgi:hypothetical protein